MLDDLTKCIEEECKKAIEYNIYGTQDFHIESIERLEDKDGAFNFAVTTWNDQSENPRQNREMSLFEVMNLLGRIIGHRAITRSVMLINGEEHKHEKEINPS